MPLSKNISVIIIVVEGKDMDVSEHERLSNQKYIELLMGHLLK
jgi:hypothetical protein